MKVFVPGCLGLCVMFLVSGQAISASGSDDFTGRWEVTTVYPGGSFVAGLELTTKAGRYKGRSGYLVPDFAFPYKYAGALQKEGLQLEVLELDGKTVLGNLLLVVKGSMLSGKGILHDVPVTVSGRRPLERPSNAPTFVTFIPEVYYRTVSGAHPPALRIWPGDTVRTTTVDAAGGNEDGPRTLPGNPQTGPFYIEGAMIGDTIAVHFKTIRPSRDTAFQYRGGLNPSVLPPGYQQTPPPENWSDAWKLDREHSTATPVSPSDKLKHFAVKLVPMLGCVSVAPYWDQAFGTTDLGPYGGNIDYNQIQEGTTLHMPVFQAGALLSIGDGHALQADGEITGQGFETSMDVEFTVDLVRDQLLDQPWAENDEYIMVSGIGGSLNEAMQLATAGLSNWLQSYYALNSAEIATVLASSIHYDIAEVVDPKVHVVAKIRKDSLSQIPKPKNQPAVFCQASWGCAQN